jgi:hypothetical protein
VTDWRRWIDRGSLRRAATAEQRRCARGKLDGGEGRAWAQPRAARELPCDPEKALGRSPGLEKRRRGELDGGGPAAAAGTRIPAKVWLGSINKRLGEVL